MPKPSVANEVDEFSKTKNDLDTAKTDPVLLQNMDQTEQELDNLESVVGALGNDTMQNLLMENPDIDKDLDTMSEAVIQIRNGMPPQQAAVTLQKLQIQKASAEAREQDLAMKSGDMARKPQGTVADLMQPPQQEESGLTDMDHLQMIEKSQKAKSSKRFKPVKKEYKTIGFWGWCARVVGHVVFGVLTAVQTLVNQSWRLGKAGVRKFIRWKNGTAKKEEEERRAREEENAEIERMFGPEDDMEPEKTPLEKIQSGEDDQEILDDYSKKPLIWEKPIAENPKQKPYVSVDIHMAQGGEEKTNDLLANAHASLALNYTRLNRRSGKRERCRVKMGYYMGAGTSGYASLPIAMLGNGSFISGQVMDDSGSGNIAIGKRYAATNKQINHILENASHYEEGGFHNLKRNCTTFVADMTQQAGIPTGDMLQKKSMNLGAAWLITPLIPVVSPIAKAIGQGAIKHLAEKDDQSFTGQGKKLLSKEIQQKYSDANDNLMTFSGFSPAAAAERMRRGGMTMLHATYYSGEGFSFQMRLETEKQKLAAQIRKAGGADFEDDIQQLMDHLGASTEQMDTVNAKAKENRESKEAEEEIRTKGSTEKKKLTKAQLRQNEEKINELLPGIVDDLQARRKYLSEWYYSVVSGSRELNIPFMHMASVLEYEEQEMNKLYTDMREIDQTRDTSHAIQQLRYGDDIAYQAPQWKNENGRFQQTGTFAKAEDPSYSNAYYVALIRRFGDLQTGLDKLYEKEARKKAKKQDSTLNLQMSSVNDTRIAGKTDEVRKGMTQADADFAFGELPEKLRGDRVSGAEKIADIYQAFAYEKVFGGMKIWLKQEADESSYLETLLSRNVTIYLTDKVQGTNKDAFRMILYSIRHSLGDQATDEDVYQRFIETFEKTYLDQVLRSVLDPKKEDASAQKDIPEYLKSLKTGSFGYPSEFKEYVLSVIARL